MNTVEQEHIYVLKNLLIEAENDDEQMIKPDLTTKEIEAIKWAINKIES
jgi:hypothetical protein